MEKPNYPIDSFENGLLYFFESVGNEIVTTKVVIFSPSSEDDNIYRLVLGDLLNDGNIDVYSTSQNNDMELILMTVIKIIELFFNHYPDKIVAFTGSTPSRTRLYRAVISKFIDNPNSSYEICGITDENEVKLFQKNIQYVGYLIKKQNGNN
jgi:hypothetical protein